jgi:hypothetical protein
VQNIDLKDNVIMMGIVAEELIEHESVWKSKDCIYYYSYSDNGNASSVVYENGEYREIGYDL